MSNGIKPGSQYARFLGCKCRTAKDASGNDAYMWGFRVWIVDKDCFVHSSQKPVIKDKTKLN